MHRQKGFGVSYRNYKRPQEHIDWAEKIVAAILGEDLQYVVRTLKNGSEKDANVLVEMQNLLHAVDVFACTCPRDHWPLAMR